MSNALRDVLLERADRAETATTTDPQAFMALVHERADARRRTRRNTLAAGGGVVLVAAMTLGALVLPSSGDHPHGAPAGGPVVATSSSRPTARPVLSLVPTTTPEEAAVAIGQVPKGWRYTGHQGPVTFYGPDSLPLTDDPDFSAVIVVEVHERIKPDGPNDLTIGGRAGRYTTDNGVQIVNVVVDSTTELTVQLPVSAPVTDRQALAVAASLVLRSKAEKTHG